MLKEVTAEEFRNSAGEGLVLADFYSATCGPCKMLSFVLADIDKQFGGSLKILKVDFDKNKDLTAEYGVTGYPTMIMMKDGKECRRMQGLQQKPAIAKMIEEAK